MVALQRSKPNREALSLAKEAVWDTLFLKKVGLGAGVATFRTNLRLKLTGPVNFNRTLFSQVTQSRDRFKFQNTNNLFIEN